MDTLEILKIYGSQIGIIGAAIAFIFGVYKYMSERRIAQRWKEFEVYHKLVKELVGPEKESDKMYLDRQAAIIFELRNFKRYYPYSLRMLKGLKETWSTYPKPRLFEELDLTIKYIEGKIRRVEAK